jgi:hypothetical protein
MLVREERRRTMSRQTDRKKYRRFEGIKMAGR